DPARWAAHETTRGAHICRGSWPVLDLRDLGWEETTMTGRCRSTAWPTALVRNAAPLVPRRLGPTALKGTINVEGSRLVRRPVLEGNSHPFLVRPHAFKVFLAATSREGGKRRATARSFGLGSTPTTAAGKTTGERHQWCFRTSEKTWNRAKGHGAKKDIRGRGSRQGQEARRI